MGKSLVEISAHYGTQIATEVKPSSMTLFFLIIITKYVGTFWLSKT
jgi:hypothetical protein